MNDLFLFNLLLSSLLLLAVQAISTVGRHRRHDSSIRLQGVKFVNVQTVIIGHGNVVGLIPESYDKYGNSLLNAGRDKLAGNSRQLSAESGGRRILKSVHGTFLRAHSTDRKADMAPKVQDWEKWYIEDHGGKVVFKAIHSPGRFLRAHPDGRVDLVFHHPQDWEKWTPFKNTDGSWSFLSAHGKWLSARQDGSIGTVTKCHDWEHFWLTRW